MGDPFATSPFKGHLRLSGLVVLLEDGGKGVLKPF